MLWTKSNETIYFSIAIWIKAVVSKKAYSGSTEVIPNETTISD